MRFPFHSTLAYGGTRRHTQGPPGNARRPLTGRCRGIEAGSPFRYYTMVGYGGLVLRVLFKGSRKRCTINTHKRAVCSPGGLFGSALLVIVLSARNNWNPGTLFTGVLLIILGLFFSSMAVEVTDDRMVIFFGPGFPGKRFSLGQIRGVRRLYAVVSSACAVRSGGSRERNGPEALSMPRALLKKNLVRRMKGTRKKEEGDPAG